jgi:hypothetical protein
LVGVAASTTPSGSLFGKSLIQVDEKKDEVENS